MPLNYGGKPAQDTAVTVNGYTYTGNHIDVIALTADDVDDLRANWPYQAGITETQYDRWIEGAFLQRHILDNLAAIPGL